MKRLAHLLTLAFLALFFAGCGEGSPTPGSGTPPNQKPQNPEPPPTPPKEK
jgi:hypothetical protein